MERLRRKERARTAGSEYTAQYTRRAGRPTGGRKREEV
jgi:hypothetical protein